MLTFAGTVGYGQHTQNLNRPSASLLSRSPQLLAHCRNCVSSPHQQTAQLNPMMAKCGPAISGLKHFFWTHAGFVQRAYFRSPYSVSHLTNGLLPLSADMLRYLREKNDLLPLNTLLHQNIFSTETKIIIWCFLFLCQFVQFVIKSSPKLFIPLYSCR